MEHIIPVLMINSSKQYWVKIRRKNKYIPYTYSPLSNLMTINNNGKMQNYSHSIDKKQTIYYWVVVEHNLFNVNHKNPHVFFTEINTTQIENIDQENYIVVDEYGQLKLIHNHLKHNGMKMTPLFFIARNISQIEDA